MDDPMTELSGATQGAPTSLFKPYPAYEDCGVEWLEKSGAGRSGYV